MRTACLAGLFAFSLGACVTATPAAPPVLQPTAQTACAPAISLATPTDLTPPKPAGSFEKIVAVTAAAPCLASSAGGRQGYAVFALPGAGKVASINAGAVIEPKRLLAASVFTAAADGHVVRAFPASELLHRGHTVSVLFTPQADERFVVVAADASLVGNAYSFVALDPANADSPAHKSSHADAVRFAPDLSAAPWSYEGNAFVRIYFADPAAG